jgi:hypothetical protein
MLEDFGAPVESVLTVTDSKVERTYHIFRTNAMDALVQILLRWALSMPMCARRS